MSYCESQLKHCSNTSLLTNGLLTLRIVATTLRTTITTTRTKVLLLAYSRSVQQYIMFEGGLYKNIFNIMLSRSGSSLLGELLSLSSATSYYYEPLRQHNLTCAARHNR